MEKDLEQLRTAAKQIVNELSLREDNPIFNYILVIFRDPDNEDALVTTNPDLLLERLSNVNITGGGDCPELAISGLREGLKYAIKNSIAYVFTDASAKDHDQYEVTKDLIQSTQTTVSFLTTGDCGKRSQPGFQVYEKLARVSNGQVYDMNTDDITKVLLAIRFMLNDNFIALRSIDVETPGSSENIFYIDSTMTELSMSLSGKTPKIFLKNPKNETVTGNEFSLANLKIVQLKNPIAGKWTVEASSTSSYSIRLGAISALKFEFGFSLETPSKIVETLYQPLKGQKNVLSIFITDPSLLKSLSSVTIIVIASSSKRKRRDLSSEQLTPSLEKITENIYATEAFDIPNEMFKIQLNGVDSLGNVIERSISTSIQSVLSNEPEILNEVNHYEFAEHKPALLLCKVKSQIPLTLQWFHGDEMIEEMHSKQSNEFELNISRILLSDAGNYTCKATNDIGEDESEIITVDILAAKGICSRLKFSSIIDGCFWIRNKISSGQDSRDATARPDQRSLLIIFDGTGSMGADLAQLKSAAQEIINEFSQRIDNPIFNYILVVFRDPDIEPALVTTNPQKVLQKLNSIVVSGGGDCPEMAIGGLIEGMKHALPNSMAFVISDASAKDYAKYRAAYKLVRDKKISVSILSTGNCGARTGEGYKVYQSLSRQSNSQVFDMKSGNVKDVILAIRKQLNDDYATLKSVDKPYAGTTHEEFFVDNSMSEFDISLSGNNPSMIIKNPLGQIVAGSKISSDNYIIVTIKDPMAGKWVVEAKSSSAHSIRFGGISGTKFGIGFSSGPVTSASETSDLPKAGDQNVITVFGDPSKGNLSEIVLIDLRFSP
ncbi:unnamed protein product [Diamesa serratosioi]